jgi:hypothetical protein
MEKPKCRICGERHYGLCPQNGRDIEKAISTSLPAAVETAYVADLKARMPSEKPTPLEDRPFDRKAYMKQYMREYMRKRRAKDKG